MVNGVRPVGGKGGHGRGDKGGHGPEGHGRGQSGSNQGSTN
jgi:hypothetical protein